MNDITRHATQGAPTPPVTPGGEPDTRCDCVTLPRGRCPRPRAWHVWAGCLQEHISESDLCDPCLALSLMIPWFCTPCRKAGAPDDKMHMIKKERVNDGG